jgi:hypothetical protein
MYTFTITSSCEEMFFSVSDPNPAAENPNDRNALAQAATGSGLLLLSPDQR